MGREIDRRRGRAFPSPFRPSFPQEPRLPSLRRIIRMLNHLDYSAQRKLANSSSKSKRNASSLLSNLSPSSSCPQQPTPPPPAFFSFSQTQISVLHSSSMSSSDYPSSPFQIPTYRLAYTFTKPSYPPSTSIHRSELEYLPPSEDEITIEVAAAGLNPVDIQMSNFWLFNWQKTNVEKGVGRELDCPSLPPRSR